MSFYIYIDIFIYFSLLYLYFCIGFIVCFMYTAVTSQVPFDLTSSEQNCSKVTWLPIPYINYTAVLSNSRRKGEKTNPNSYNEPKTLTEQPEQLPVTTAALSRRKSLCGVRMWTWHSAAAVPLNVRFWYREGISEQHPGTTSASQFVDHRASEFASNLGQPYYLHHFGGRFRFWYGLFFAIPAASLGILDFATFANA